MHLSITSAAISSWAPEAEYKPLIAQAYQKHSSLTSGGKHVMSGHLAMEIWNHAKKHFRRAYATAERTDAWLPAQERLRKCCSFNFAEPVGKKNNAQVALKKN